MSVVTPELVDDALLQGTQEAISLALGEIPVVGSFVSAIFGHVWDLALAGRTAAQKQAAMNSLFGSIQKMIDKSLAENIADQARAYNASIAQQGQDYRTSVESFKESGNGSSTAATRVVARFENCKATLDHMLNLFGQQSYMKHTVLSYGNALSLYVTILREMQLAGKSCGYSNAEIKDLHDDVNARLTSAYQQTMYDAVKKLVTESGEFYYPNMGEVGMNLGKLVGGLMNFQTEWHDGKNCLLAPSHPDYADTDLVDNQAYYQLRLRRKSSDKKYYYAMPQVFFGDGRAAYHVYTNLETQIQHASFVVKESMAVRIRVYYLVDMDNYDSSDILVTIKKRDGSTAQEFHTNKRYRSILSVPWVRLYYSNTEGGAWSTHWDKFSSNFRFYYDEYDSFNAQEKTVYTIYTSRGSSDTKNYYIIGFEVVPLTGVPGALESILNAVTDTAGAVTSAVTGAIGKLI